MSRKVVIRRNNLNTAVAYLEQMVRNDYKEIYKSHIEDLEDVAETIEKDAQELAPVYTGETRGYYNKYGNFVETGKYYDPRIIPGQLRDSINVRVVTRGRYPGIIASASARNVGRKFDYALIQEENEDFVHTIGQAHYLSSPFYQNLYYLFLELTGKELDAGDFDYLMEEF